jgi:hypothetical protein
VWETFESVFYGMNESMNAYKTQTDTSVNSLRLETSQNKDEVKNKVGELPLEIRSVASSLDEFSSTIQTERQEIQKLIRLHQLLVPLHRLIQKIRVMYIGQPIARSAQLFRNCAVIFPLV